MTPDEETISQRWHVTENDVVGGWAIINMEVDRLSQVWGYGEMQVYLEAANEDVARYVVAMHNHRLGVDGGR